MIFMQFLSQTYWLAVRFRNGSAVDFGLGSGLARVVEISLYYWMSSAWKCNSTLLPGETASVSGSYFSPVLPTAIVWTAAETEVEIGKADVVEEFFFGISRIYVLSTS